MNEKDQPPTEKELEKLRPLWKGKMVTRACTPEIPGMGWSKSWLEQEAQTEAERKRKEADHVRRAVRDSIMMERQRVANLPSGIPEHCITKEEAELRIEEARKKMHAKMEFLRSVMQKELEEVNKKLLRAKKQMAAREASSGEMVKKKQEEIKLLIEKLKALEEEFRLRHEEAMHMEKRLTHIATENRRMTNDLEKALSDVKREKATTNILKSGPRRCSLRPKSHTHTHTHTLTPLSPTITHVLTIGVCMRDCLGRKFTEGSSAGWFTHRVEGAEE